MRRLQIVGRLLFLFFASGSLALAAPTKSTSHLIVSFPSGDKMLLGYMYRPAGKGPFPAVIFHHGAHKGLTTVPVADFEALGKFFTGRGYLLFLPDRHPQSFLTNEFSESLQRRLLTNPTAEETKDQRMIESLEIINRDIVAALGWLKKQPDIKTNQIAMAGVYSGGVQTILAGQNNADVRCLISFYPGVTTWKDSLVFQGVMSGAVRKLKAPLFLIFVKKQPQPRSRGRARRGLAKKG